METKDIPRWQILETKCLDVDCETAEFRIHVHTYVNEILRQKTVSRLDRLESLWRITDYVIASTTKKVISPVSTLFDAFSVLEVWSAHCEKEDYRHKLAALALISTATLHENIPAHFVEIEKFVNGWVGVPYTVDFNDRTSQLSRLFFGDIWTSLFERELSEPRVLLDLIMTQKPKLVFLEEPVTEKLPIVETPTNLIM